MIIEIQALAALRNHGTLALSGAYLHLEPSTVWKRIKNLEDQTGLTLLQKRGRRTELTADAVKLLEDTLDPLRTIQDSVQRLKSKSQSRVRVRIGVSESLLLSWAPELFQHALRGHDHEIDLQFSSHLGPVLHEKLKSGALDLVLSAGVERADPVILSQKLKDEKVFFCTNAEGEIKKLSQLSTLYCINRHSLSYDLLEEQLRKLLKREAFTGEIRELELYAGIAALIREGYGVGFVPQGIAELYGLKIRRNLYLERPISLHFKKGILRIPQIESFIARTKRYLLNRNT